jgi:acyl-CoA reductase-like NAD-dependent aldehyde dehydrogenase
MQGLTVDRSFPSTLLSGLTATGASTQDIIAPFTGEVLYTMPLSSVDDVVAAATSARLAGSLWQKAGFAERRRVLLRAHDLLLADRDHLLDLLQTETGKTRGQAFEEIFLGAGVTRYYAVAAARILRTHARRAGIPAAIRTAVRYSAKGVVGVITPWNYPVSLTLMDVIPALAAGNAVVQKADSQGALSVLATRRAFIEAGLPPAVWAVVAGDGEAIGSAVVDVADYVCFTGSTATGTRVGERAAARLIGASLELGGKNPLIVLDDVNPFRAAADAAFAAFSSMGQLCVSTERIYVQRDVAAAFTTAFVDRVGSLVAGSALDYSTDVGSLATRAQLDRVTAHVDDAVARGATVLVGGHARPDIGPLFFEPTVLSGVTPAMVCYSHETFGPLVALFVVDSEAEAVLAANASEFGLNASVFSGSVARARRLARQLNAGSVNINEGYRASFSSVDAPMGGIKHSGLGRRNGPEGLLRFVDAQTIAVATGLVPLPRTGREFAKMTGLMVALLVVLKALRRR